MGIYRNKRVAFKNAQRHANTLFLRLIPVELVVVECVRVRKGEMRASPLRIVAVVDNLL